VSECVCVLFYVSIHSQYSRLDSSRRSVHELFPLRSLQRMVYMQYTSKNLLKSHTQLHHV